MNSFFGGRKNLPKILIILCIALVQGLIYVFITPPWQHYDETGNFEYAWLIANRPGWPQPGAFDPGMRLELLASLKENNASAEIPNVLAPDGLKIAISQTGDLPLYFLLASLPLRVFQYTDITFQLYSARIISLLLFLLTVWVSYKITWEIFPAGHPLVWMIPLFLTFLPGFVDLMTSVNDDVAAIAFTTVFFFFCNLIILKGFSFWRILGLAISVMLGVLSKATGWITLPLGLLAIGLGLWRGKNQKIFWAAGVIVIGLAAAVSISWNVTTPAYFFGFPQRVKTDLAPVGKYAIVRQSQVGAFYQMLTPFAIQDLNGKPVTLGLWAWADQPVVIPFPTIQIGVKGIIFNDKIQLTTKPTFYAFQTRFPKENENGWPDAGWLHINPSDARDIFIYFDGFVLARGYFAKKPAPEFSDANGASGYWGGVKFQNLLRNASGEAAWPTLNPFLIGVKETFASLMLPRPWYFLDPRGNGWYFQTALQHIFRTFWGRFGSGTVPLLGNDPYLVFSMLALSSICGIFYGLYKRHSISRDLTIFWLIALFLELIFTLLRGAGEWFWAVFIPPARYLLPVIFPISFLLTWGWYHYFNTVFDLVKASKSIRWIYYFTFLILLDVWAIVSIATYYY